MRQFSTGGLLAPFRMWSLLGALSCFLCGCGKEATSSYSIPKEKPPTPPPAPVASQPMLPPGQIRWITPAGWEELPASGMRVGSFAVSKNGQRVDISIIPLAGISGSELENVNRWRGQVGLGPVDSAQLAASAEKVLVGKTPGSLYDLGGTDPQSKQAGRIVASILSGEGTTWFFKMTGPDALVTEQKPAFVELLKSIEIQSGQAHAHDEVAEAHRQVVPATPAAPVVNPAVAAKEKPAWEVPAGWEEQAPSSMRLASFLVKGEKGAKADLSVIKLSGQAGGNLANVNRWRAQIGLQPLDEGELTKQTTVREVEGSQVIFVDMVGRNVESGEPARMLAAIVPKTGVTWFYKMLGDDALVARQKDAFIKFIETARYPHAP